jgi:TonB family protein
LSCAKARLTYTFFSGHGFCCFIVTHRQRAEVFDHIPNPLRAVQFLDSERVGDTAGDRHGGWAGGADLRLLLQAQLVQLPAPTPPPPPKVIPPPKPLPAIIPKPLPVPSKIVVATKPPPPVHHIYKPVTHPVVTHQPAPPVPITHPMPPAAAPPSNGIPIYGSEMHNILEQNQNVPQALAQLGISGTAVVQITVAPDGHVISAKLVRSGGNSLIDQTALDHAMHATFPPFGADMPSSSLTFNVPVNITPQDGGSDDSDDSGN